MKRYLLTSVAAAGLVVGGAAQAQSDWSLEEAAEPYSGTTVNVMFLDRPGYDAIIEMLPEFEERTGINIEYDVLPYDNTRERQVLDFTGLGELDIALIDLVWLGEFVENDWVVNMDQFLNDEELRNPDMQLDQFHDKPLEAFGQWDGETYGLPFDNYAGMMFYNECMLEDAGFDQPPETWMELKDEYGPALTNEDEDQYAFALQSRRGETQSADSFMRMVWPFGGSLLDEDFRSNLTSEGSLRGLEFRQELMDYMPPGIVEYNHAEAVNALGQGNVAMITEWSSFYPTLANSPIGEEGCLEVATEPAGPAGTFPALGGFSLGILDQASEAEQAAAYLFIQWATGPDQAKDYVLNGGISAHTAVYEDPEVQEAVPFHDAMLKSWDQAIPHYRPRFAEWPRLSEIIAEVGTSMMLGQVGVEEGAEQIGNRMETILRQAGYYAGEKPKVQ